jgi:uncharacterized protein YbgA (DUF1722 family)
MHEQEDNEYYLDSTLVACSNQERIDQVLLLSNGYLYKQLDHIKKTIIDDLIQQTRRIVSRMSLWKT